MSLPTIASFWHGPLSWLEHLSMASFVEQGHRVDLYCYDDPGPVPQGVRVCDASAIVPGEKLVFYKGKGTPGVFSDLFRMNLLKQGKGVWADLDVICVKPIAIDSPYFFGYERSSENGRRGSVNGAVLFIERDAPLLDDLLSVFAPPPRPLFEAHLPPMRRWEVALRRLAGKTVPPEDMQYGATGPFALTHFVQKRGLEDFILPREVFYPVPYEHIGSLVREGTRLETYVTQKTLGVHVWRSRLTERGRRGIARPAPDSAFEILCRRYDMGMAFS